MWKKKANRAAALRKYKRAEKLYLLSLACDGESDMEFCQSTLEQLIFVQFKLEAFNEVVSLSEKCSVASSPSKVCD